MSIIAPTINRQMKRATNLSGLHQTSSFKTVNWSSLQVKICLNFEARVIIIDGGLGADTTSSTLSSLFYLLLTHPVAFARLREEVDTVFPLGEDISDYTQLASMPYLNACM